LHCAPCQQCACAVRSLQSLLLHNARSAGRVDGGRGDKPTSLTPIYSDPALSVPGNAVSTLFMLGDAATPIALLRRDR